jgi:hypothetical protein
MVLEPLSRVRVAGPLEPFAVGFAGELGVQGYRPQGVEHQLRLMAHLSRWLAEENLEVAGLTGTVVGRFMVARRAAGYKGWCSSRALEPLLGYLRALGQAPPPRFRPLRCEAFSAPVTGTQQQAAVTSRSCSRWFGSVCAVARSRICSWGTSTGNAGEIIVSGKGARSGRLPLLWV